LTETVVLFAEKWNLSPFDVLQKDIDDFILIVNYFIEKGGDSSSNGEQPKATYQQKRKDDFWDM